MKRSRQLSILTLCAVAALGINMAACGDDPSTAVVKAKIGEACGADNPCDAGLVCGDEGKCVEADVPAVEKAKLGEDCSAEKACEDGLECGSEGKCVEKSAPVDEKAKLGEDCSADKACDAGLVCGDEGKCVEINVGPGPKEDPCEGVNCPDGKQCLNARCYDPECIDGDHEKACDNGQMCSKGVCIDDGCQDKTCGDGEVCSKGVCEDALCLEKAIVCNDGSTCVKGACVDNECLGETCDAGLTCSKGVCMYPACVGKEACATGKSCNESGDCVFSDAPALKAEADKNETDENGAAAAIALSLNNPPSKDVTVTCSLSPESAVAEAMVDCGNVLFDNSNYSNAQVVQVVGLPDGVIDEDQKYSLTITTVSEDPDFNGLETVIEMLNKNIDKVGVNVTLAGDMLTTSESGGSAVFTVVLNAKPEADVTFEVSSNNEAYGVIDGATEGKLVVTFTPENWDTPQEIKVVGVDDNNTPNNGEEHKYQVVFSNTSSEDVNYQDVEIAPIDAINLDNDIADVFVDKASIETVEKGDAVDFNVHLGLEPKKPVNITLSVFKAKDSNSEESGEVALSETSISLDKDNFLDGKTISVTSLDDSRIDGDQDYFIRLRASSDDNSYHNIDKWITGKSIDSNIAAFHFDAPETNVSEDETPIEIGVSLTAIPEAPVEVAISTSNKYEMVGAPAKLTFTPENWNVAQKITVNGIDDLVVDGDQVSDLKFKATSEDQNFNIEDKLEITTIDNDVAEILIVAKGEEIMENSGDSREFKVVLASQPQSQVRIKLKSSDESELKIYGQQTIIFNEENWNVPQTVILQVLDDNYADGTQIVHVDLTAASEDKNFDGLTAVTPDYSILDNESASITLTAEKTIFKPGEPTQTTVKVSLSAPPENDVPVKVSSTNGNTVKLGTTDLVFTTSNWNTPQEITVTTDVSVAASNKSIETISALASGTGSYKDLKSNDVAMTLYYFIGSKDFAFTGAEQTMNLLPGKYKLQVWGASGGGQANLSIGSHRGLGGYAEGILNLTSSLTAYVYVGGAGAVGTYNKVGDNATGGGWNGGGHGTNCSATCYGYGGGGGTDIRLGQNSLYARVIVAGGGGGADDPTGEAHKQANDGSGGVGGGATGGKGELSGVPTIEAGTQVSGFAFGRGENSTINWDHGGGGGGWFGGLAVRYQHGGAGGAGGSGFVYTSTSNVSSEVIKGTYLLSSDKMLQSAQTIAGSQSFPSTGAGNETGHGGNGYARITFVE